MPDRAQPATSGQVSAYSRELAPHRDQIGPSPVDRGRPGSKHHLICDAGGVPLAVLTTGGHRNDVTQLIPLIEAI